MVLGMLPKSIDGACSLVERAAPEFCDQLLDEIIALASIAKNPSLIDASADGRAEHTDR